MNRNKLTFQRRFKCFSAIYIFFIFIVIALAFNVWAQGSFKEGAMDIKSKPAFSDKDIQPGEHEYKVDGNRKYLLYIPATYNTKNQHHLFCSFMVVEVTWSRPHRTIAGKKRLIRMGLSLHFQMAQAVYQGNILHPGMLAIAVATHATKILMM